MQTLFGYSNSLYSLQPLKPYYIYTVNVYLENRSSFRGPMTRTLLQLVDFAKSFPVIFNKLFVECSFPIGAVLRPLLFLIYLNKILTLSCTGKMSSFADETIIFYDNENWQKLKRKTGKDVNIIMDSSLIIYCHFHCEKHIAPYFINSNVLTFLKFAY